jgi:hypothetical protein
MTANQGRARRWPYLDANAVGPAVDRVDASIVAGLVAPGGGARHEAKALQLQVLFGLGEGLEGRQVGGSVHAVRSFASFQMVDRLQSVAR